MRIHRRTGSYVVAALLVTALAGCSPFADPDQETCDTINLANEQIIIILSNPSMNSDATRTRLNGVKDVLQQLQEVQPSDQNLAEATDDYAYSIEKLMNGFNSALDGKRSARSLQPDVADFQVAGAELLNYCDLD